MIHLETENVWFQLRKNFYNPVIVVFAGPGVAVVDIVGAEAKFSHNGEILNTLLYTTAAARVIIKQYLSMLHMLQCILRSQGKS